MNIAYVWQGVSDPKIFEQWNDGLREAVRIISKEHQVTFYEPWDEIVGADVILYHEAPCTINGPNADYYNKVREAKIPKALLFAGGPLRKEWVSGFNLVFIESEINVKEALELGIPHTKAFGINDSIFKPEKFEKQYDGLHHGTCASWKRQGLVGQALGDKGLVVGRRQPTDFFPFQEAAKFGATVLEERTSKEVAKLINQSHTLVQTSDFWGGGQRATLEAMACGVPPVVMSDSPKNIEFVEDSGFGLICDPDPEEIRLSVYKLKEEWTEDMAKELSDYVKKNWSAKQYANKIIQGLKQIC